LNLGYPNFVDFVVEKPRKTWLTSGFQVAQNSSQKAKFTYCNKTDGVLMGQARVLSDEEFSRLMRHAGSTRYGARNQAILGLTHLAGLRVGEVAALRWRDVLSQDGAIFNEFRLTASMTKGGRARTVYVSQKLKEILTKYAASSSFREYDAALVPSQKDRRGGFNSNTLAQTLKALYAAAGIDQCSSHSGRRSFLTNLADRGVGIHVLAHLAGHRNISTTARYLYASPRALATAVNLA
jgi:integrase/recombinase XerD